MEAQGVTLQLIVENSVPILQNLLSDFIAVVIGIVVVQRVQTRRVKRKFGNWRVLVLQDGVEKVNRAVSHQKAKEVLEEEADLSVFLKGVVSPYAKVNCDLISEGKECGLLHVNHDAKRFIVNLDCNPCEDVAQGGDGDQTPSTAARPADSPSTSAINSVY